MSTAAQNYESFMVPRLFDPIADELLTIMSPQTGDHVLDVATGTGVVARKANIMVGKNGRVVGIDITPAMLDVARSRSREQELDIEWRELDATQLPFEDGEFDVVLCQSAFMFFTDKHTVLSEMHRVLKRNGHVGISVFGSIAAHPFYQRLHEVVQENLGESGVEDIFSLGDELILRKLLVESGFRSIKTTSFNFIADFGAPEEFISGEIDVDTAAIPTMQHLSDEERAQLKSTIADEMVSDLQDLTVNGNVMMPFQVKIATATAN